jgi:hypothetical protein
MPASFHPTDLGFRAGMGVVGYRVGGASSKTGFKISGEALTGLSSEEESMPTGRVRTGGRVTTIYGVAEALCGEHEPGVI